MSRRRVHLGDAGIGVSRRRVHLGDAGRGMNRSAQGLRQWFEQLAARLRRVRVCCGDWSRVCGPAPTSRHGLTGVFLDPPYDQDERAEVYNHEDRISAAVRQWAIEAGRNPEMRIALCGYEGEHAMPPDWTVYEWTPGGGYGSLGEGRGRANRARERIWFSPACLPPRQGRLL